MKTLEEIKQRLIAIEIEQRRQDREVNKLNDFNEEIKRFEKILSEINDSFRMEQPVSPSTGMIAGHNLEEINRIEEEIAHIDELAQAEDFTGIDEEEQRYLEELKQLKFGKTVTPKKEPLPQTKVSPPTSTRSIIPAKPSHTTPSRTESNPPPTEQISVDLAKMDDYVVTDEKELRYLDELKLLKAKLSLPKTTKTATPSPSVTPKTAKSLPSTAKSLPPPTPSSQHGYVICLMFDLNSPNEWSEESGGGWRERGGGTHFTDPVKVKQCLQRIKKNWPNYPLKIIKR